MNKETMNGKATEIKGFVNHAKDTLQQKLQEAKNKFNSTDKENLDEVDPARYSEGSDKIPPRQGNKGNQNPLINK